MKSARHFPCVMGFAALSILLCVSSPVLCAACGGVQLCSESATFTAQLTDFRTSISGSNRLATATLRIQNKTDRALTLGYVSGSGLLIDDHGNRYSIDTRNRNAVRAIGLIDRNTFDPKFTLQAGENADARFEFSWYAGKSIVGTVFQMELTIREVDSVGAHQRLGREHALQFQDLTDKLTAATAVAASAPAVTAPTASAPAADACAGKPRCHNAGRFIAEIVQVTPSSRGNNHLVRINLRLHNPGDQRVILGYATNSGVMVDNYGNRYTVDSRSRENVQGIGEVTRTQADPQFVLNPGESRNAVLQYSRYVGKTAIGTVFAPDLAIKELEVLPSQQVREVREYALSFANVTAGGAASADDAARQLSEGLKSLFKKKKD